ncbi:restriction endonuclease subunit S [Tenacibaculum dicentrarchi]|uniref:restriction endonuclease subunit S n=1 Tax=Tenacibaculum dicentrarchi TaxID=669041 RepID=UPI003519714D
MANRGDIKFEEIQPKLCKNWLTLNIEETLDKTGSFTKLKSKDYFDKGKFPVIDQGDSFISGFINDEKLLYKGELPVIIFGDHTRVLKFIDFQFATGADGTKVLKPLAIFDNLFYFYYLKSLKIPSLGYSRHFKILKTINVPLPPLAEQQRIVAKLDTLFGSLDALKIRLNNIPQLIKNFKQAVLTQAVTGKLTQEWRVGKELEDASEWRKNIIEERNNLKLPKRTPGLIYEEVKGGFETPSSWTFGFLQNFGEFTRGKSKHRPRNDKKLFGGDYPFIQTGEVSRSNGIIKNYTNTYSEFGLAQSRLFPKGTLCITIAANIAETGILDFDACFPDSVVGYLPYKKLYTVEFAMFCLMTMQKDLEHFAPSTAQKNINLGILFEVPFPIPPKEEQTEIVKRVENLFSKADAIENQYKTLKEKIDRLPQAILAKAFKGELVAQLPTDGDAKDLLEEIKKLKESLVVKPKKKVVRKKK